MSARDTTSSATNVVYQKIGRKTMSDAYNIELDYNKKTGIRKLLFQWNNLDFEVELDESGIVLPQTLECLCEIVKQVDFPPTHGVWRDLRNFVEISIR